MIEMSADLAEKITKKLEPNGGNVLLQTIQAAIVVLRHYLGDEFIARKVALRQDFDSFMLNNFDEESDDRLIYQKRVVDLADHLFQIRDASGFDEICNRLEKPDTQAAFADVDAASFFKRHGFDVQIRKETGKRGNDFDFSATLGRTINIEVTSSTAQTFRAGTLKNILDKKRSQVPAAAPAGLYVVIPFTWFDGVADLQAELTAVTDKFFRGSGRYNFVTYVWHAIQVVQELRLTATVNWPVTNPNARHPPPDLSLLTYQSEQADIFREAIKTGKIEPPIDFSGQFQFMRAYRATLECATS